MVGSKTLSYLDLKIAKSLNIYWSALSGSCSSIMQNFNHCLMPVLYVSFVDSSCAASIYF